MAAGFVTINFLDGGGTSRTGRFWSSDGTVTGLLYPAPVLADDAAGAAATIKAASTAPVATDTALVVAISPNSVNANGSATSANSAPVVIASDQAAVATKGGTASGSSVANAPTTTGGRAATANPTAVTDGQVVNTMHDKLGKLVAVGAIRTLKGIQDTTITASTAETTIVTQTASTFNDLYGLILANSSATPTSVTIKDSTSGTTRAVIYVPAGDTRGFMLPVDSALPQATVNTNWTATSSASITSLFVSALFVANT